MAFVSYAELPNSPDASYELGKYEIRRYFRVIVSSRTDGPQTVVDGAIGAGMPTFFQEYSFGSETNAELRVRKISPTRWGDAAALLWKVEVLYSTPDFKDGSSRSGGGGGGGRGTGGGTGRETAGEFTNPLLELPTIKFHSSGREVLLTQIYDNTTGILKPCTDSTGAVFDPPPKTTEPVLTLEISRNEPLSANHPALAIQYQNAVNSDTFWSIAPGYWKVKEIVPELQNRQISGGTKVTFWRVTYTFEANANGWDIQLLDYGPEYLVPTNVAAAVDVTPLERRKFLTAENHPTSGALNGRGGALAMRIPVTVDHLSATPFHIPATTNNVTFTDGDAVLLSNVGGALPINTATGAVIPINAVYYVRNFAASGGGGYDFNLVKTIGGPALTFSNDGSGRHYIGQSGVFLTIRPFNRLPFSFLGLPQIPSAVQ